MCKTNSIKICFKSICIYNCSDSIRSNSLLSICITITNVIMSDCWWTNINNNRIGSRNTYNVVIIIRIWEYTSCNTNLDITTINIIVWNCWCSNVSGKFSSKSNRIYWEIITLRSIWEYSRCSISRRIAWEIHSKQFNSISWRY